ncbi:MAG: N-acetylglucosamine-6-phosphate deacetylase [Actinomycetota bacterium]|nr:N-acetylglucosamine-6-phosphate deacetylase [Actinomycetota bacterium]
MIISGRLVRGAGAAGGWVEVQGGRIAQAGVGDPPRPADVRHDGPIAPGFVDLQVNGGAGVEVVDGPEAIERVDARQLRHGVTSYLPTIITTDDASAERALDQLAERAADPASPVVGVHLEGPFLSPQHRGVHRAELLRAPADGVPDYYQHPAVRLVTLAPELPGALTLIERLVGRGVTVSLGHTGADAATAERAADCGATLVTHLFNAMSPFHHRAPGLVGWALVSDRVDPCVVADELHVAPLALELIRRAAGERVILVTDSSVAAGADQGEYLQAGVRIRMQPDGRAVNRQGTLAGSAIGLDAAVRNWAGSAGAGWPPAIAAASVRPAKAIGLVAGLESGDPADLVLLDEAGLVVRVMRRGEWCA